ncbi:ubiquitin-conjugating enzyme E2 6 [Leucogyrophana mollusca]|uniref:Ubiquitin-conjugating enzyme E2 6 n=1 Tax=Leucogyrophana mollusca TaxID=85980 RepID=A0ACB8B9B7_9AGAM|nr:ubiquitin-conjugating enzyme E2 6 [Leucogyrophana mollusca]
MASKAAQKRLTKEYVSMQREPPPFVWAVPDEKNILTWNYLIRGPPDSPFAGGEYHGVLLFPSEYPFKPPGIKMFTPSGRFQPDKKICFSMSDFHPGSWNPAWSVQTILTGLLSFMLSDEMTTGSMTSSDSHKRSFAARSHSWNLSQPRFKEAFLDYCTPTPKDLPNMGERERGKADTSSLKPVIANAISPSPSPISPSTSATQPPNVLAQRPAASSHVPVATDPTRAAADASTNAPLTPSNNANTKPTGWPASWRQVIWEKWRWGVLIALAVIVSRMSSSS